MLVLASRWLFQTLWQFHNRDGGGIACLGAPYGQQVANSSVRSLLAGALALAEPSRSAMCYAGLSGWLGFMPDASRPGLSSASELARTAQAVELQAWRESSKAAGSDQTELPKVAGLDSTEPSKAGRVQI